MRRAAARPINRQIKAVGASVSSPVGGWNARDSLSDMKPDEAVTLDNWYPSTSDVTLRRGYESYATGLTGAVETLMVYASGSTQKMFACANSAIYDVSDDGAVGSADVSGLTNNRWQYVNFGTAGGNFIICVNGADAPRNYNGTAWATTPAITGVTPANLIHVNVFKQRLFFIEKNTLSAWYLGVASIGGSASELDFSSICKLGGELIAMGTWTIDGGTGIDDYAVWITSKGEVIIYQGTDPSDATKWALVGVFNIGAPVGRRCMFKVGSDLIIITQDGFSPLSSVIAGARTNQKSQLSDKISGAVNSAVRSYGSHFGWQAILYPKSTMAVFNVPVVEGSTSHQYIMNTTTKAWCRFTGMNANCWEVYNDNLYFGGTSKVYKADTGVSDDGGNITGDAKTAFNYFGRRGQLKRFTMVRPIFTTTGNITTALNVNVDFEDRAPTSTPTFSPAGGAEWDIAEWDVAEWDIEGRILKEWQSVEGLGYCASIRMRVATNDFMISWNSVDYLFEPGGYL